MLGITAISPFIVWLTARNPHHMHLVSELLDSNFPGRLLASLMSLRRSYLDLLKVSKSIEDHAFSLAWTPPLTQGIWLGESRNIDLLDDIIDALGDMPVCGFKTVLQSGNTFHTSVLNGPIDLFFFLL